MVNSLAAYDAAPPPPTPPSPAPLAVYLVADGVPTEIVDIHQLDMNRGEPLQRGRRRHRAGLHPGLRPPPTPSTAP